MKLYDGGRAPNPRRVRIFLAEKGLSVPLVGVDMAKGEHLAVPLDRLNPLGRLPVLEFDDGRVLTESVAICRYFEETSPEPPLFGTHAFERAKIEEWNRRVELDLYTAIAATFRHLHPAMVGVEKPQVREWGEANRGRTIEALRFLDGQLATSPFVAGERFSIADITALVAVDFLRLAKIERPAELSQLSRWYGEVSARPSAKA